MGNVADERTRASARGETTKSGARSSFYRSVGATRFIEQGEALLAASA